jgi:hypothetical protein
VPTDSESMLSTWQECIYEPRETMVKSIADATLQPFQQGRKWNRGYIESLIRPRITTLILSLVAHFGTQKMSVEDEDRCRSTMPNFCMLVFGKPGRGFIQACCRIISVYVCSLLTNVDRIEGSPVEESNTPPPPAWLPQSLQCWVNDAKDMAQKTLRLMPLITLATSALNVSTTKATSLSDLLVSMLEKPDRTCQLQQTLEEHCSRRLVMEEADKQTKERERREKKQQQKQKGETEAQDRSDSAVLKKDYETPEANDDGELTSIGGGSDDFDSDDASDDKTHNTVTNNKVVVTPASGGQEDVLQAKNMTPGGALQRLHEETGRRRRSKVQHLSLHPENRQNLWNAFGGSNAALPNSIVRVMRTSVHQMAVRHFIVPGGMEKFLNDEIGRNARVKIDQEMIGEIFTVCTKFAERHAKMFLEESGPEWSHVAGKDNLLESEEATVATASSNQDIGSGLLGGGAEASQPSSAKNRAGTSENAPTTSSNKNITPEDSGSSETTKAATSKNAPKPSPKKRKAADGAASSASNKTATSKDTPNTSSSKKQAKERDFASASTPTSSNRKRKNKKKSSLCELLLSPIRQMSYEQKSRKHTPGTEGKTKFYNDFDGAKDDSTQGPLQELDANRG